MKHCSEFLQFHWNFNVTILDAFNCCKTGTRIARRNEIGAHSYLVFFSSMWIWKKAEKTVSAWKHFNSIWKDQDDREKEETDKNSSGWERNRSNAIYSPLHILNWCWWPRTLHTARTVRQTQLSSLFPISIGRTTDAIQNNDNHIRIHVESRTLV